MPKLKKSYRIIIDEDLCKGCNICVEMCKSEVFVVSEQINSKGYYAPIANRQEVCNGCGICDIICPEFAVILFEDRKNGVLQG